MRSMKGWAKAPGNIGDARETWRSGTWNGHTLTLQWGLKFGKGERGFVALPGLSGKKRSFFKKINKVRINFRLTPVFRPKHGA